MSAATLPDLAYEWVVQALFAVAPVEESTHATRASALTAATLALAKYPVAVTIYRRQVRA